jgi:hypothetical protein
MIVAAAPATPPGMRVSTLRRAHLTIHHHAFARLHTRPCGSHRIVRTLSGPEAVAVFAKARIDQGLQHLQQCLLNQPICHRGDAQFALGAVRLGNHGL